MWTTRTIVLFVESSTTNQNVGRGDETMAEEQQGNQWERAAQEVSRAAQEVSREEGESLLRANKAVAWSASVKPVLSPEAEATGLTARDAVALEMCTTLVHSINFTCGSAKTIVRVMHLPDGWLEVLVWRDGQLVGAIDLEAEEGVEPLMTGACDCSDCCDRKARVVRN